VSPGGAGLLGKCKGSRDSLPSWISPRRTIALQCMQSSGLGVAAQRWVSLLQVGLQGMVRLVGRLSPSFAIRTGLPPGSPLSPLLYVIAAQPLATPLRQEVARGALLAINLQGGTQAHPSHQHADDATIHLRTRADISAALDGSVHLYCQASASLVSAAKPHGFELGDPQAFAGLGTESGSPFNARGESI